MARYLGIEVTEGQVKGLVLKTAYRKLQIEAVHRVQRGPGLEGLAAAVQAVVQAVGGPIDASYSAMPGTEASLRIIELPKAVVKRGGKVIATELEGSVPFEIDTATVDHQVIRQDANVEMIVAAVRTDRVRAFIDAMRAGGVDPREVGIGPVAIGELASEIPELAAPGPVLVLHAYETLADFTILSNGVVQLARTLGAQTTPTARARAIRQTLSAYLAGGGQPPVAAYLCGESAWYNMDVVADALSLTADQVKLGIPLGAIELAPSVPPSEPQVAPLALALALRGLGRGQRIDMRKGDLAVVGGSQFLRERGWMIAACLAGILMSWGFMTYMRYTSIAEERDALRTALGRVTLDAFGERVTDPRRAKALALGSGPDAEQDPLPLADAYDVIGVLSARIADNVHHDIAQLDVQDERIEIQGIVDTLQNRDQIVESLQQYECFQNVQPGRAQRNPGDTRQQYSLNIEFRCPERQQPAGRSGRPGAAGTSRPGGGTTGSGR